MKGKKQSEKSGSEKFLVNAIVYLTGAGNGKNLDETLALFMPVVKKVLAKTALRQVMATNLNDYLPETPSLTLIEHMKVQKQPIPGTDDFMNIVLSSGRLCPPLPRTNCCAEN